jgi:hypothetical protein
MWRTMIAVVLLGCSTQNTQQTTALGTSETASMVQDELDNVARCFHDSVSLLQREPAEGESLSDFLAAGGKARAASRSNAVGGFARLRRNAAGSAVVVGPDAIVRFVKDAESHDDSADGRSTWSWTYRFTADGRSESAETIIVLSVGDQGDASQ